MPFTLYDATITTYQQILGAVAGLLDKAEAFCAETGMEAAAMIDAKLADDMLPFGYQVKSVAGHSWGAVEGVRSGIFTPDRTPWPSDFAGLKAKIADARNALDNVDADEINALVGRDMAFVMGERRMEFTAEDFLLSFSMPNFYFHAVTAYDILRWKGVKLGKMDFMGRPRMKG